MIPTRPRLGFTLIEIVVALLIGSILTSSALSSYGNATARFQARGARDSYASMHARARAMAIERGENVRLYLLPSSDRVIITDADATWPYLDDVDFRERFDVDIQGTNIRICMNARGYADVDCNSFSGIMQYQFVVGADSSPLTLLPMGQLNY